VAAPDHVPALVGRRVDGWLVGWLAVAVWSASLVTDHTGAPIGLRDAVTAVYWIGAVVTAAHFGLSYHLAYRDGARSVRARPFALMQGPLLLVVVLGGLTVVALAGGADLTRTVTSALITSVYLMTTWHYIKQTYGVGRVGAAFGHVALDPWDVRILRYGLYPLWFLGAAQVLVRDTGYSLAGFPVGYGLLPAGSLPLLRALALVAALPVLAVFVRAALRRRALPPAVMIAPYVAAFLWLGLPPNPVLTVLLLAPFHGLQYLAIGHRAEVATATARPSLAWWLNIFVGAACGGLLISHWLPGLLDAHVHATHGRLLFGAAFFVFLNLHHYLIDAVIWRSKGDLVRSLVRRPAMPAVPAALATTARAG
jgi:hypothetical protein